MSGMPVVYKKAWSTLEHHPCFELFYRNTGGFLYGKPCVTRLSTFLAYVPIYHETPKLRRCFYTPLALTVTIEKRKTLINQGFPHKKPPVFR